MTLWHTIIKSHPSVRGVPVQRLDGTRPYVDARKPRPYRTRTRGVGAHTGDLFLRAGCRACPHRRGVRTVERAALRRSMRMGAGLRRRRRDFRPSTAGSPFGVGGAKVNLPIRPSTV